MKATQLILIFTAVFLLFSACASKDTKSSYELAWSDEFDYSGLPDPGKWDYDTEGNPFGWGNSEAQHYTKERIENALVDKGILKIVARKETWEDKVYTSARLISRAHWQYGKIEVRAKVPAGRGTWSAIWMMPAGWTFKDGNWPDVGEFDIMEHVGYDEGVIHASAHSRDYQWQNGTQKTATIRVEDATREFHSYIWEWSPDMVRAYVDDSLYFEYINEGLGESKWPYDKPFYLILNVAVGGEWGRVKGIDDEAFPQSMEVDYVRVYQKKTGS